MKASAASVAASRVRPGREVDAVSPGVIHWRPSRWLLVCLLGMAASAPVAVLVSEMPRIAAWPLAGGALAYGLIAAWWEMRRPSLALRIHGERVEVDGVPVAGFRLVWRGPLAFARWRDGAGRCVRRVWWPDTLPSVARRELRLAAPAPRAARRGSSVAP